MLNKYNIPFIEKEPSKYDAYKKSMNETFK
jgi:hypothetical protein